ncbi:hypothetical protein Q2K19_19700 [Micromonospora soli]|uniref:hypothetical protein n=1 Tax=Micromonospora sp. NBRC 110009 TaxID=3061627 RepID=UPI002671B03B|nr:hypothetical protein [Micromonospora sp. NBRC 110009]WKT96437.1 hypothetical protein Q2K19_19700 [Micromonospora sp. NBRC 110009]
MSDRDLYCDTCEGVALFEAPPCVDGHGADCPELICTGCGAALLVATVSFPAPRLDHRRSSRRVHRRAA